MAQLNIDLNRRIGAIDPKIFGSFVEHLGRCVYGGIFDPQSELADSRGFRRDVLAAVQALRIPLIRYPGGNFVSGYHWLDGVGPVEERPKRLELAWHSLETNQFGTNEFIEFCRAVGSEPYICANLGSGTMDEAAAWVEYCNGKEDTPYANLRRKHGYEKPHNVRYWGLGNELYGSWQIGHKEATEYAKVALEFAKVMKWTDPTIRLIGCGAMHVDWDWELLKRCGQHLDYIAAHFYFAPRPGQDSHYSLCSQVDYVEEYIHVLWQLIQAARRTFGWRHSIRIAVDEWNVWYRAKAKASDGSFPVAPPLLEEVYDLTDALTVGAFLNMMQRNCHAIGIGCLAQLVNVIAPIITRSDGLFRQTIYYPLLASALMRGEIALQTHLECDTFPSPHTLRGCTPFLDVCATMSEKRRKLFISVVNFHKEKAERLKLRLQGMSVESEAMQLLITGPSPQATNGFDGENVTLQERRLRKVSTQPVFMIPRHSMCVFAFDIR